MKPKTHAILVEGKRHIWRVDRLWHLARQLEPFDYVVADFDGLDEDHWYCGVNTPTIRSVLDHARRMQKADLSWPILLSESGAVMDGIHRICRAHLEGRATLRAVRFAVTPAPDVVEDYTRPSHPADAFSQDATVGEWTWRDP